MAVTDITEKFNLAVNQSFAVPIGVPGAKFEQTTGMGAEHTFAHELSGNSIQKTQELAAAPALSTNAYKA